MTKDEPYYLAIQNHRGFIGVNCSTWGWNAGVSRGNAIVFNSDASILQYDPFRVYEWARARNLKLHKIPVQLRHIQ